jgi:hypothetical protein
VAAIVAVPVGRGNGWVPETGTSLYLAHAVVGGLLGAGAAILVITRWGQKLYGACATVGFVGVAVGAAGGALTAYHSQRALGMGLMLAGTLVATFAYGTAVGG